MGSCRIVLSRTDKTYPIASLAQSWTATQGTRALISRSKKSIRTVQPGPDKCSRNQPSWTQPNAAEPIRTQPSPARPAAPPADGAAPAAAGAEDPAPRSGPSRPCPRSTGDREGRWWGKQASGAAEARCSHFGVATGVSRVTGGDRASCRASPACLTPGVREPIPVQLQCCSILPPYLPSPKLFPLLGIFQGLQSYSLAPSQCFS